MMILYPWKVAARFEDGFEAVFGGNDEEECMYRIDKAQGKHGGCTWYSGYCDENYMDGEYIGN